MIRFHQWIAAGLVITVLACSVGPVQAAEAKGTITLLRPERNQIVLTESFKDMTFYVDNSTRVLINGHVSQLVDLREGDQAAVGYQRIGRRLIAVSVHVNRGPQQAQFPSVVALPRWERLTAVALHKHEEDVP